MISFFVPGIPAPKGSFKIVGRRGLRGRITNDNERTKPWEWAITAEAMKLWPAAHRKLDAPFAIKMEFYLPRPQRSPQHPTKKPDIDKLARSVNDALTAAGIWRDDSCLVDQRAAKFYSDEPGVRITLRVTRRRRR